MKMLANAIYCFEFLIVFYCLFVLYTPVLADKLLAVTVIYRHGDRPPLHFYSNDPYKDPTFWPVPLGELTNTGKMQQYQLGKWLRERYKTFLSSTYKKNEIHISSSDVDRCLMSAQANLAGLYPPVKNDIWNNQLPWQPIPIHTLPKKLDGLFNAKYSCPIYSQLLKEVIADSEYFKKVNEKYKNLYEYIANHSGNSIKSFRDTNRIRDTLFIEDIYKLPLPEWTLEVYPEKLNELWKITSKVYTFTDQLTRLMTGRFFDYLLKQHSDFTNKKNNKFGSKKFHMMSGHDSNLVRILAAMKVDSGKPVPYAAAIIFELVQTQMGAIVVKSFYKEDDTIRNLKIFDCDEECDYNDFVRYLEVIVISEEDYKKECGD